MRAIRYVRRHWRWFAAAAAALGLLAIILIAIFSRAPNRPRESDLEHAGRKLPEPEGTAARAPRAPAGRWIGGIGIVEPRGRERQIGANVAGRVASVPVEEGSFVEAGAVLVELDSAAERAALAAAEAEEKAAESELLELVRGTRREEVRAAMARAQEERAKAKLSRGVYQRLRAAGEAGGVTTDELARARRQAEADQAAARAARQEMEASIEGPRQEEIAAAEARLEAAQSRREQARAALEQRIVRAPISGEVLDLELRPGEFYQPGDGPLMVFGDTRALRARIEVPERQIEGLRLGARAVVRPESRPEFEYAGRVADIGDLVRPKEIGSEEPGDPSDVRVLPVWVDLQQAGDLVVGERVMGYIARQDPKEQPEVSRRSPAPAPR